MKSGTASTNVKFLANDAAEPAPAVFENATKERGPPSPQQVAGTQQCDRLHEETFAGKRAATLSVKAEGKARCFSCFAECCGLGGPRSARKAGAVQSTQRFQTPAETSRGLLISRRPLFRRNNATFPGPSSASPSSPLCGLPPRSSAGLPSAAAAWSRSTDQRAFAKPGLSRVPWR